MKILLCLITVLCLILSGCAASSGGFTEPPVAELSAAVVEDTLSSTEMTVRLQNDATDYFFVFGDACSVEKYAQGKWSEPTLKNDTFYSDAIAYCVQSEGSTEQTFSWKQRYGELDKGKYRLVVHMTIRQSDGSDNGKFVEDYTLYVPFEL